MQHPDLDLMIVMERRREELAYAAQSRLIREARRAGWNTDLQPRWHLSVLVLLVARGLSFLGDRMLNWSCRLQYRYMPLTGAESQPGPCR